MTLKDLLADSPDNSLSGIKWHTLKQSIVKCLLSIGDATILELSTELQSSIPTITKAVNELLGDELIVDSGKISNSGGRRPSLYSMSSDKTYFLGVEANRSSTSFGIQNLKEEFVSIELNTAFVLENTYESLMEFCGCIDTFISDSQIDKSLIIGLCVNLSGRINSKEGFSYNYFFTENRPLVEILSEKIGMPVYLENDTRAMTLGEYAQGVVEGEKNVVFLNYSWGIGIGIITEGELYYGKSGYSGEFGHSPLFDNEILCHCGKIGCLETEASGWALVEQFKQALADGRTSAISIDNNSSSIQQYHKLLSGVLIKEDSLCIELITKQCEVIGRALASLINILNPELLIIGGDFSQLGDFVLLPIQSSLKKYSLGLVNRDVALKKSILGRRAGVIGACRVVKEKMLSPLA
ncbi:putative NBD/HSP70 family sugar kinase [Dysgonomonas hofstadii]|uniref:Putative NBD/HSP70 family sugar kinase n=1 Tax=Dysgonomonas hofstadii TaxID=637886 RepID=A0A840CTL6_9BACT|nr:ROK family protein [Dysgonomonas hofstadii]MBB4038029.1 putative NBD/HSP70 family sugar kinase [Dysgonomonas hofstadii]